MINILITQIDVNILMHSEHLNYEYCNRETKRIFYSIIILLNNRNIN